ncbi:MAG: HEAT repeat domain-containing protein [Pirellulaceae bacterium]
MNQYVDNILHAFASLDDDHQQLQRISMLSPELGWVDDRDIDSMLDSLCELGPGISPPVFDRGLEIVLGRLTRMAGEADNPAAHPERIDAIEKLYRVLPAEARSRNYLLNWQASMNTRESLERFGDLIIDDPPLCPQSIVVAFAPLVQHHRPFDVDAVFPNLLGGLQHPGVAAAILDVANFVTRQKYTDRHPASDHLDSLIRMLGMLTEQLTMLEEGNPPPDKSPQEISRLVNETVSLIASLCDALSLIGDTQAIGKLNRAAELKHRRIRAEALSALAHLGDEEAGKQLVALAAEPVIRLRVLQYADELGLSDQIDEAFGDDVARAESQLAMWLAHHENMGLAPNALTLIDRRRLAWPGYDDEVDCFLFRYSYEFSDRRIENIGIAGPLTHAFSMNLEHLELADVYACFAGWHCTHDEIIEMSLPEARLQRPGVVERLMARLSSEQIDGQSIIDVDPVFLGLFMGEEALVAAGRQEGKSGSYVIDRDEVMWFPPGSDDSPARDELAYCIYKGRRLLGAFNQPDAWPGGPAC